MKSLRLVFALTLTAALIFGSLFTSSPKAPPHEAPAEAAHDLSGRQGEVASNRGVDIDPSLTVTHFDGSDTGAPVAVKPKTWKRSEKPIHSATLQVGEEEHLPLEAVQVHAHIDGFRARVLVDYYFFNDRYSTLEGSLKVRLPGGASPFYLAFGETQFEAPEVPSTHPLLLDKTHAMEREIAPDQILARRSPQWQQTKEARMISRDRAAYAYRETVRRRVDPALLEWAGPDFFSANLYPLSPEALHHVVIGYDVDLELGDNSLSLTLPLPEVPGAATLDIDYAHIPGLEPTLSPASAEVEENEARTFLRYEGFAGKEVTFRQRFDANLLVEGHGEDERPYLALSAIPELPDTEESASQSHAIFLLDTSLSASPERFQRQLNLLAAILEENRSEITHFNVATFNIATSWWKEGFVENSEEEVTRFLTAAQDISLEGATDLGLALREAASPTWHSREETWDLFLLSDGVATWGEEDRYALTRTLRQGGASSLFAYSPNGGGDALLAHLARETGGALFSMVKDDQVEGLARAHRKSPWRLRAITLAGAKDLLIEGDPGFLYPGQPLKIVARGALEAQATLNLTLARKGYEGPVVVQVPITHRVSSSLACRAFGEVAVDRLEALGSYTRDASTAFAHHFRVVGRSASLLMLETEDDYLEHGLEPRDDDAQVSSTFVGELVAEALAMHGESLGDPKASTLRWMEEIAAQEALHIYPSEALMALAEALPAEAYTTQPAALKVDALRGTKATEAALEALSKADLVALEVEEEAARRHADGDTAGGLVFLSSLVERSPRNAALLRDVAYQALEWERPGLALQLFSKVVQDRPWEPQTYHAMALAAMELDREALSLLYFELGLAGRWDSRFGDFPAIVALDYSRFLRQLDEESDPLLLEFAETRKEEISALVGVDEADLVVTLLWNTDSTDVDLHVLEPTGETCNYSNRETAIGGRITQDVTQGYGPEMYVLEKGREGDYEIKAKYYSSDTARLSRTTKVYITLYQGWGSKNEKVAREMIRLDSTGEVQPISSLTL